MTGITLYSFELRYWRAIHAELMTHRVFSRNAGSSRAIPVKRVLAQVWNDPAGPIHWGLNEPGMQARAQVAGWRRALAGGLWRGAGKVACAFAWSLMKLGLHKQVANRLLEPWQYINVVLSSTEWDNFFGLRCHPDAQPEFQELATAIHAIHGETLPHLLEPGEWHLIYVSDEERGALPIRTLCKLSTARAARVSISPFDGDASIEKELNRYQLLVGSSPIHASPTEHPAQCNGAPGFVKNFRAFTQLRCFVEDGVTP